MFMGAREDDLYGDEGAGGRGNEAVFVAAGSALDLPGRHYLLARAALPRGFKGEIIWKINNA